MADFSDLLIKAPNALEEYVTLPKYGDTISVYEGLFSLQDEDMIVNLNGRIYYSFAEKVELLFDGEAETSPLDWLAKSVEVVVGESYSGTALIEFISGKIVRGCEARFNTKISVSCDHWRWCYLNGPKIFGDIVRRDRKLSRDRLVFQDGGYEIILENADCYEHQKKHREISQICELRHIDGLPVTEENALREIRLFSRFFSFFSGCMHAPFFMEGLTGNCVQYVFHVIAPDSSLTSVSSWKPDNKDRDLLPLWKSFRLKNNESLDQQDVLNTVIHWYLQANMNSGLLEGAIILGFTGIELLSSVIVGKELGSNEKIVEDFISRMKLALDIKPSEIALTRNYLMHYKNECRRKAYNSITFEEKVSRLEIVLQLLELAILYWLGYEGHYSNRMHQTWRGENVCLVPWKA